MKLNDVKRFSAYVRTIYHSEYITMHVQHTRTRKSQCMGTNLQFVSAGGQGVVYAKN